MMMNIFSTKPEEEKHIDEIESAERLIRTSFSTSNFQLKQIQERIEHHETRLKILLEAESILAEFQNSIKDQAFPVSEPKKKKAG